MSEIAYSFRRSGLSREQTYRLGPDALEWSDVVGQDGRFAYAEIAALRFQKLRIRGALAATIKRLWACVLIRRNGRKIVLLPTHHVRSGAATRRRERIWSPPIPRSRRPRSSGCSSGRGTISAGWERNTPTSIGSGGKDTSNVIR